MLIGLLHSPHAILEDLLASRTAARTTAGDQRKRSRADCVGAGVKGRRVGRERGREGHLCHAPMQPVHSASHDMRDKKKPDPRVRIAMPAHKLGRCKLSSALKEDAMTRSWQQTARAVSGAPSSRPSFTKDSRQARQGARAVQVPAIGALVMIKINRTPNRTRQRCPSLLNTYSNARLRAAIQHVRPPHWHGENTRVQVQVMFSVASSRRSRQTA